MKITKLGHCCLLIEHDGKRILTDPGSFTVAEQQILSNLDVILITHEHGDHCHVDSVKVLVRSNPMAVVVANSAVGALLAAAGISVTVLEGREVATITGISVAAYDTAHAEIDGTFGQVQNTGYFIAEKLFYPGDAYTVPEGVVPGLALPVSGPWAKVSEVIAYAQAVAPQQSFPVHDGLLNEQGLAIVHKVVATRLEAHGVLFTPLKAGEEIII